MKLVVGLGNPGAKYHGTRHNVGFAVAAELARRHAPTARPKHDFLGEVVEATIRQERTLLLCPHTFMNRSGASVAKAVDFYKLVLSDILVVCDDFHLGLGRLRIRPRGTSGGQKGLKDIIAALGAEEVPRLRLGIGEPPGSRAVEDYVLSHFTKQETSEAELLIVRAADAVETWISEGIATTMNRFNAEDKPASE